MRKILAFAWLPFLALALAAQTQPPATGQQGNLAQIIVGRPKPGSEAQYDEGRKRHMAWHRSQNDAWSWFTWEITTGDDTGAFVTGSFGHRWADYDAREKFITADEADVAKNVAPYRQSRAVSYWVFRPDISRSMDPEGSTPYVQITHFFVNPDGVPTFIDSVKKINAGIQKTNYPAAPGRWYQLVNGGQGPHFVLAVGRKNLGEMQGPEKTLDQMMAEAYGEQEGRAILDTLRKTYKSTYTELLRLRSDLSYTPGGATAGTGTLERRDTRAADLAAIEKLHQEDIEVTLSQDPKGLIDVWTEDGVRLYPGRPPVVGKQAIQADNEKGRAQYPDFKVLKYAPEIKDVQIADGWAIEIIYGESTYKMSAKDNPSVSKAKPCVC